MSLQNSTADIPEEPSAVNSATPAPAAGVAITPPLREATEEQEIEEPSSPVAQEVPALSSDMLVERPTQTPELVVDEPLPPLALPSLEEETEEQGNQPASSPAKEVPVFSPGSPPPTWDSQRTNIDPNAQPLSPMTFFPHLEQPWSSQPRASQSDTNRETPPSNPGSPMAFLSHLEPGQPWSAEPPPSHDDGTVSSSPSSSYGLPLGFQPLPDHGSRGDENTEQDSQKAHNLRREVRFLSPTTTIRPLSRTGTDSEPGSGTPHPPQSDDAQSQGNDVSQPQHPTPRTPPTVPGVPSAPTHPVPTNGIGPAGFIPPMGFPPVTQPSLTPPTWPNATLQQTSSSPFNSVQTPAIWPSLLPGQVNSSPFSVATMPGVAPGHSNGSPFSVATMPGVAPGHSNGSPFSVASWPGPARTHGSPFAIPGPASVPLPPRPLWNAPTNSAPAPASVPLPPRQLWSPYIAPASFPGTYPGNMGVPSIVPSPATWPGVSLGNSSLPPGFQPVPATTVPPGLPIYSSPSHGVLPGATATPSLHAPRLNMLPLPVPDPPEPPFVSQNPWSMTPQRHESSLTLPTPLGDAPLPRPPSLSSSSNSSIHSEFGKPPLSPAASSQHLPPPVPGSPTLQLPPLWLTRIKSAFSVVIPILFTKIPQQIYLNFLLRLPLLYFSRVSRLLEDANLSLPDIQRMAIATADQWKDGTPGSLWPLWHGQFSDGQVAPKLLNFRHSWEGFIDSLLREWKTQNVVSALMLSAILTMLQIGETATDPITRTTALMSLICALMSLLFGSIYIIRFGTMRKMYKAAMWAEEARKGSTALLWNVWILLAIPAVWLAWSIILFVTCIMAFVWRTGGSENVLSTPPATRDLRIGISAVLVLALAYLLLIVATFQKYGETMDKRWKDMVIGWTQEGKKEAASLSSSSNSTSSTSRNSSSDSLFRPSSRPGETPFIPPESLPPSPTMSSGSSTAARLSVDIKRDESDTVPEPHSGSLSSLSQLSSRTRNNTFANSASGVAATPLERPPIPETLSQSSSPPVLRQSRPPTPLPPSPFTHNEPTSPTWNDIDIDSPYSGLRLGTRTFARPFKRIADDKIAPFPAIKVLKFIDVVSEAVAEPSLPTNILQDRDILDSDCAEFIQDLRAAAADGAVDKAALFPLDEPDTGRSLGRVAGLIHLWNKGFFLPRFTEAVLMREENSSGIAHHTVYILNTGTIGPMPNLDDHLYESATIILMHGQPKHRQFTTQIKLSSRSVSSEEHRKTHETRAFDRRVRFLPSNEFLPFSAVKVIEGLGRSSPKTFPLPRLLNNRDVLESDWTQFLRDLQNFWYGDRKPTIRVHLGLQGSNERLEHIAALINVWYRNFFHYRSLEAVLCKEEDGSYTVCLLHSDQHGAISYGDEGTNRRTTAIRLLENPESGMQFSTRIDILLEPEASNEYEELRAASFDRPFTKLSSYPSMSLPSVRIMDLDIPGARTSPYEDSLADYDILEEDWSDFARVLHDVWTGKKNIPPFPHVPGDVVGSVKWAASLIHLWNTNFFRARSTQAVLFKENPIRPGLPSYSVYLVRTRAYGPPPIPEEKPDHNTTLIRLHEDPEWGRFSTQIKLDSPSEASKSEVNEDEPDNSATAGGSAEAHVPEDTPGSLGLPIFPLTASP